MVFGPTLPDSCAKRSIHCSFQQLVDLIELMLSFHAAYKYLPDPGIHKSFFHNTRRMMSQLKKFIDRGDGTMGWEISKFHELLHLQRDVMHFGSPTNYDAAKTERGLQQWVKKPSVTVAKRGGDTYQGRVATRLTEMSALQKTCSNVPRTMSAGDSDSCVDMQSATPKTINFIVKLEKMSNNHYKPFSRRWRNGMGREHNVQNQFLDDKILKWLYEEEYVTDGSFVYSEVTLKDGTILRGSPNFVGTGPWYDWVTYLVETEVDGEGTIVECPF